MTYLSYVTPLKRDRSALWSELCRHLPEESREFFAQSIFANNWYPRTHLHAFMRAFKKAVNDDVAEVRELGAMAARYQVHVIYRVFLKFATPAMVFNRAASVWSRQSTVGHFIVVEEGADHLVGELEDPRSSRRHPRSDGRLERHHHRHARPLAVQDDLRAALATTLALQGRLGPSLEALKNDDVDRCVKFTGSDYAASAHSC